MMCFLMLWAAVESRYELAHATIKRDRHNGFYDIIYQKEVCYPTRLAIEYIITHSVNITVSLKARRATDSVPYPPTVLRRLWRRSFGMHHQAIRSA
jgi:hypothetical protein